LVAQVQWVVEGQGLVRAVPNWVVLKGGRPLED